MYYFIGHDVISQLTWKKLHSDTMIWLCTQYSICSLLEFKTVSALPDLFKHHDRFIKYFDFHFYNNPTDIPPLYCSIDISRAFNSGQTNLIKAIHGLSTKFISDSLTFTELSYFIHLVSDLHQPLHSI